jgi:hypothetical protein
MTVGRNRLAVVLALGVVALVGVILYANHLGDQRINDIQASRISSCKQTYRSFPEMFSVFPISKANRLKLQNRADELASRCGQQVEAK